MPENTEQKQLNHQLCYTSSEVADQLGVSINLVRTLSRDRNVGTRLGRDWLYSEADVESLRKRRPRGRPRKEKEANDA